MANAPINKPASDITLLASAARTATSTGDEITAIEHYSAARFSLAVTAASGTSPTLNVYVQTKTPSGHWTDLVAFTQKSAAGREHYDHISATRDPYAEQDAGLTAGQANDMLLGSRLRVKYVIGGTNPSFTFAVTMVGYAHR